MKPQMALKSQIKKKGHTMKQVYKYSDYLREKRIRMLESVVKFLSIVLILLITFFAGMMWERSEATYQRELAKKHTKLITPTQSHQTPYILQISRKGGI